MFRMIQWAFTSRSFQNLVSCQVLLSNGCVCTMYAMPSTTARTQDLYTVPGTLAQRNQLLCVLHVVFCFIQKLGCSPHLQPLSDWTYSYTMPLLLFVRRILRKFPNTIIISYTYRCFCNFRCEYHC